MDCPFKDLVIALSATGLHPAGRESVICMCTVKSFIFVGPNFRGFLKLRQKYIRGDVISWTSVVCFA